MPSPSVRRRRILKRLEQQKLAQTEQITEVVERLPNALKEEVVVEEVKEPEIEVILEENPLEESTTIKKKVIRKKTTRRTGTRK